MGEVSDPWEPESLVPLTEEALRAPLNEIQEGFERMLEAEHGRRYGPLHEKWGAAAWRMNDDRNNLLEGIVRFAVSHRTEIRECLGWTAPPPHPF